MSLPYSMTFPTVSASQISISDQPLGRGSFGSVWKGSFSGCPVAVKVCSVSAKASSVEARSAAVQFRRETTRYQHLRHPCITQFFCVVEHPATSQLLLVTELMKGGSLFDAIGTLRRAGVQTLNHEAMLRVAKHVTNGLSYLHASNFSFGDLKTMNVLLSEPVDVANATFTSSTQAKLCDFGLSRNLNHLVSAEQAKRPRPGETLIPARNGPAGTFAYLAPEAFSGLPTDDAHAPRKADVFALAVVLWELATLRRPWPGKQALQLIRLVKKEGKRPEWGDVSGLPKGYVELVERCWAQQPNHRPSAHQVAEELERMYDNLSQEQNQGSLFCGTVNGVAVESELGDLTVVEVDEEDLSEHSLNEEELHVLGMKQFREEEMSVVTGSHQGSANSPASVEMVRSYSVPVEAAGLNEDIENELVEMQALNISEIANEMKGGLATRRPRTTPRANSYYIPMSAMGDDEDLENEMENMDALAYGHSRIGRSPAPPRSRTCPETRSPAVPRPGTCAEQRYARVRMEDVDKELSLLEGEEVEDIRTYGFDMRR